MKNKRMNQMKHSLCAVLAGACLLLPGAALGVTEGAVEDAPMVENVELGQNMVSYLPDESYYASYAGWESEWEHAEEWVEGENYGDIYEPMEQRPRLMAGEAKRAKALMEKLHAGEIAYTGESVLNKMENVVVGVYALDPASYDGEKAYVLLPGPCMTDEQLLALISAFDEMGLTFDPDALSYRNCARGGGVETSRFWTEEEGERAMRLRMLAERGVIDISAAQGEELGVQEIRLDNRYYAGLDSFALRPYRATTDEEFCAVLRAQGVHDMTDELDLTELERRARSALTALGAPLSMEMEGLFYEGGYVPMFFDGNGERTWTGDGRRSYGASFQYHTPEGILVYANATFDWETRELVDVGIMHDRANFQFEEEEDVAQADIDAATAQVEALMGLDKQTWHVMENKCSTNWGLCAMVSAQVSENRQLIIYIGVDDGKVHGLGLESGTRVDTLPEEEMPMNG